MFYIKYLTMHKVHMHAGAIRQLLFGCAYVREIIHSLKLVDYPPVHTHRPYNNLHLMFLLQLFSSDTCLKAFVPVIAVDSHLFITIDLNLVYFESYLRNGDASNFETHLATACHSGYNDVFSVFYYLRKAMYRLR